MTDPGTPSTPSPTTTAAPTTTAPATTTLTALLAVLAGAVVLVVTSELNDGLRYGVGGVLTLALLGLVAVLGRRDRR